MENQRKQEYRFRKKATFRQCQTDMTPQRLIIECLKCEAFLESQLAAFPMPRRAKYPFCTNLRFMTKKSFALRGLASERR